MLEESKKIEAKGQLVTTIIMCFIWIISVSVLINALNLSVFLQAIVHFTAIFGGLVIIYKLVCKKKFSDFVPINHMSVKNWLFVFLNTLFALPAIYFLMILFFSRPDIFLWIEAPLYMDSLLMMIVTGSIFPSVFEELLFRGVILYEIKNTGMSIKKAALINGFIFGVIHINPIQIIFATFFGIVWVYFMLYTKNILAPIISHFLVNTLLTISFYIFDVNFINPYFFNPTTDLAIFGAVALVCIIPFTILMKKFIIYNKNQNSLN